MKPILLIHGGAGNIPDARKVQIVSSFINRLHLKEELSTNICAVSWDEIGNSGGTQGLDL